LVPSEAAILEVKSAHLAVDITLPQKEKLFNSPQKPKVIVISGPTAVGKSDLAIEVSKALGGEIISADSMQIYRGMDIGTAKVTIAQREKVPHHLIDIRDITEKFNVVDFYFEAHQAIQAVLSKGAVPVVVGGTGFYIRALIYGPPSGPPSIDDVRKKIELQMDELGPDVMYDKLKALDEDYASSITVNDRQKIVRAFEIISITSQKVSSFSKQFSHNMLSYDFRCWFLFKSKEALYRSIEERCDAMISLGLIEEVKLLQSRGLARNSTACQAIGYRQCLDFLATEGTEKDRQDFIQAFKQASRRYAKRQFTWFRKEPLFRWLDAEKISIEHAVEVIVQDFEQG
jgi:tRNA dimethylallyltransferase